MFSRALKSLWTVSLLGDAPSSPIPTGRLAILFIRWQEVFGLGSGLTQGISPLFPLGCQLSLIRPSPFCLPPVTRSEHLQSIFLRSPLFQFLFCFLFFSFHSGYIKALLSRSLMSQRFKIFWQKQKHWQAFELRNKNLPRCALCKRDILLRMRGGARKLRWHCAVIWTAVQKQRSECWFKRGVRRVGEKHLPTLPALTQWGQD